MATFLAPPLLRRLPVRRLIQTSPSPPALPTSNHAGRALALAVTASSLTATLSPPAGCESSEPGNNDEVLARIKSKLASQASRASEFLRDSEVVDAALSSVGSSLSAAISSGIPTDLSYGFMAGYLSGFALKKVGRVASVTLGLSFLALQSLAYAGYIDVNHDRMQRQVEELLDRNGDGKVDGEDLRGILEDVKKVAGHGVDDGRVENAAAGAGGFGLGFVGGLRAG